MPQPVTMCHGETDAKKEWCWKNADTLTNSLLAKRTAKKEWCWKVATQRIDITQKEWCWKERYSAVSRAMRDGEARNGREEGVVLEV